MRELPKVNGHFTEREARAHLSRYGAGRVVYIMAGAVLHVVKDDTPMVRNTSVVVEVTKRAAALYLVKLFDFTGSDAYKINVTVYERSMFLGGH